MSFESHQLLINGQEVDLSMTTALPLNYGNVDVRNPDRRLGAFSKTITLAGSAKNNRLFGHIYEVNHAINNTSTTNFNPDFNPNLLATAEYRLNGTTIFRGYAQLLQVNVFENYQVEYQVSLSGTTGNFFSVIRDRKMSELNMSEADHEYSLTTIQNSMAYTSADDGYVVYPMIDYGRNNNKQTNVHDYYPAYFIKYLIDKIFAGAGYTYTSSFFTSTYFKKIIFPFIGENFTRTTTDIANRGFKAQSTSDQDLDPPTASFPTGIYGNTYPLGTNIGPYTKELLTFTDDSTAGMSDASNQWNTTSSQFQSVQLRKKYRVSATLNMRLTFTTGTSFGAGTFPQGWAIIGAILFQYGSPANPHTQQKRVLVGVYGSSYTPPISFSEDVVWIEITNSWSNGQSFDFSVTGAVEFEANSYARGQYGGICKVLWERTCGIVGNAASYGISPYGIYNDHNVWGLWDSTPYGPQQNAALKVRAGSYVEGFLVDVTYEAGDAITAADTMPVDMKQADFIAHISKVWNLFWQEDPNNEKNIIIEPRDSFYSSDVVNIEDKVDYSKGLEIVPMGELNFKEMRLRMAQDGDALNKKYINKFGKSYGSYDYEVENDHIKDVYDVGIMFAPTPLFQVEGTDRVISAMYFQNDQLEKERKALKPRLLYWGGSKSTAQSYTIKNDYDGSITTFDTYGYAGHLDNPANPSIDLNFAQPEEVYYWGTKYTDNNIGTTYWLKYLQEISDKDSRIIRARVRWTELDLGKLDLRKKYRFLGTNFRLLRIHDFDPLNPEGSLTEFLKTPFRDVPSTSSETSYGGRQPMGNGFTPSRGALNNQGLENYFDRSKHYATGLSNRIDPSSTAIVIGGQYNVVDSRCGNIYMLNCDSCSVMPFTSGVVMIGCTNMNIDPSYSNTLIINNSVYAGVGTGSVVLLTGDYELTAQDSGKTFLVYCQSSNITITASADVMSEGFNFTAKHIGAQGRAAIVSCTDGLTHERGYTEGKITGRYNSITFRYYTDNKLYRT